MPFLYADNAAMTKAKAMYGRRLRSEDYEQLLQKNTVPEIAAYLKQETAYAAALANVRADSVHRGQLEDLIHRQTWEAYQKLVRFARRDRFFLLLYTIRHEVEQLIQVIRNLSAGTMGQYQSEFPAFLAYYFSFDLFAVAEVKSYGELLEVLRHTGYYQILGKLQPHMGRKLDILECERELRTYFYQTALKTLSTSYSGDTYTDLRNILFQQIELYNYSVLYRMKRFFHADSQQVRRYLLPIKTNERASTREALIEASTAEDFLAVLEKQSHITVSHLGYDDMENLTYAMRRQFCRRAFRFSIKPPVVLLSYMTLLEIEISNIINIIEGIRYGVSPDEIRKLLVL